jgi:hypothetical protein
LLLEKIEQKRQQQAEQQARGQRKIKREISLFNENIAGQFSEKWNALQEIERRAGEEYHDADEHQDFSKVLHRQSNIYALSLSASMN